MAKNALSSMDAMQITTGLATLLLVAVVVVYSGKPGGSHIAWAYHIGDQPLFRLLYLVAVVLAAQYSLPVALLATMLYMVINSMIPVLSQLDENFIWSGPQGAPVSSCDAYSAQQVKEVGTPFYPLNTNPTTTQDLNY